MIRIQMGCLSCGQMIDGTFAARSVVGVVSAFDSVHLYPQCQKEPRDGGEEEAKPASGASDEGVDVEAEASTDPVH